MLSVDRLLTWCIRVLWLSCFIGFGYFVHDLREPPQTAPVHVNIDGGLKLE